MVELLDDASDRSQCLSALNKLRVPQNRPIFGGDGKDNSESRTTLEWISPWTIILITSVDQYIRLSVCLFDSIYPSIYFSIYLYIIIYPSHSNSIYLSIRLSNSILFFDPHFGQRRKPQRTNPQRDFLRCLLSVSGRDSEDLCRCSKGLPRARGKKFSDSFARIYYHYWIERR